jgi:hypothetical protein
MVRNHLAQRSSKLSLKLKLEISLSPVTLSPKANSEANQLQRSLRKIQQEVLRMGTLVEQSFRLSHQTD